MNFEEIMELIGELGGTMKYFQSDSDARLGIAKQLAKMASSLEQVRWLVGRLPELYVDWPGMLEVRALFCSRYKPLDGIEADSTVYLEGIPALSSRQIAAAPMLELAAGEPISADLEMAEAVAFKASRCVLPPPVDPVNLVQGRDEDDYSFLVRQAEAYRKLPIARAITQSDIDRVLAGKVER